MLAYFEEIVNNLSRPKYYLYLGAFLLVGLSVIFSNTGIFPLGSTKDLLLYSALFFIFALYRPGWSFLFFISAIVLENVNLAPKVLSVAVRPYQLIGALTLLAVIVRMMFRKSDFSFPKFNLADWAVLLFGAAGFLSVLGAPNRGVSLKQSIIALSFVAFYFLVRIFIQNLDDLKKAVPFFLISSAAVISYGIWQNVRFAQGLESFGAMPGRPNGTFPEADWLGIFLVLVLTAVYTMIYYSSNVHADENSSIPKSLNFKNLFLYLLLVTCHSLLILTVSRSAWLGALAVTLAFLALIFTGLKFDYREWQWKKALCLKLGILISLALSIGIVHFFHLTTFQLFNRIQSTGSGLQKITIACEPLRCGSDTRCDFNYPTRIEKIDELAKYRCRHINLEDIQTEKEAGMVIWEVERPDPNVGIRARIYRQSWEALKTNPILGIGWGNSGLILGNDERGVPLNSSNIFLETWLGSGIIGLLALAFLFAYLTFRGIKMFWLEGEQKIGGLVVLLGLIALIIPNLFNAGLFLGFAWVFLGIAVSLSQENKEI